jgi:hypothetical protein
MKSLDIPALVQMANANDAVEMDGTMDPVRALIASHDVVIAIWQDFTRPQGFGLMVVKGDDVLRAAFSSQEAFTGKVTAIKCVEAAQAMALLLDCGGRGVLQ